MTMWESTDLDELISCIESGGRPRGGASEDSGDIPSLGGENIRQSGGLDLESVKKVPLAFFERMSKGILEPGDVLINKDGANTGKVGLYESQYSRASINEHLFRLRGNPEKLAQRFLYYVLLSPVGQENIRARISGSAQPGLKRDFIRDFPVHVPVSIKEQCRIAEVLATIDRAIEQSEALITKYRRIKTGLMQDLLTRGIDDNGNLRAPTTHKFKPSPLGSIPQAWEAPSLAEHLAHIEQGWSPNCEDERATSGEWGVVKTTAVVWQGFDHRENKRLPSRLKPRPRLEVSPGDVLMTRAGPNSRVGVVAYVYATQPKLILSDKIYRLQPKSSIQPQFLSLALSSDLYQRQLSRAKTGMAESQTNISQGIVRSLRVPLPREDEQRRITGVWRRLLGVQKIQFLELQKLQCMKTGLLQDLLTGKVSVAPLLAADEEEIT